MNRRQLREVAAGRQLRKRRRCGRPATARSPLAGERSIEVISGIYAWKFALQSGMTVSQLRQLLKDRLDIQDDDLAALDGVLVPEHARPMDGQVLNFVRHAGEMGAGRRHRTGA